MKKRKIYGMVTALCGIAALASGCGKEEKLVMVTTEHEEVATTQDASAQDATKVNEDITIENIRKANEGDSLLSSGYSYAVETVYYDENGKEYESDYQFLGFSDDGMYLQAARDAMGNLTILDNQNGYWYLVQGDTVIVQIYPEPSVTDAIINVGHNDFIVALTEENQVIKNITELDGKYMVKTEYTSGGDKYVFEYTLNDALRVLEYVSYDLQGNKKSRSVVTEDASFKVPETIQLGLGVDYDSENASTTDADAPKDEKDSGEEPGRIVTCVYPETAGLKYTYVVPTTSPVDLKLLEYRAYTDEACTDPWVEVMPDSKGNYPDEVIYLKN